MPFLALFNRPTHSAQAAAQLHSQSPSAHSTQPANHPSVIGTGSRGQVEKHQDRAIKSLFKPDPKALKHEMNMWNAYLHATGKPGEAYMERGHLNMPYIEGGLPTDQEVKDAVDNLFKLGFMIGDPKAQNFKKTPGEEVVPVDFGQVFKPDRISDIDPRVMSDIVHDYAKGGFKTIPEGLKADYRSAITDMAKLQGNHNPLRRMNVRELRRAELI
ncbi:hypothetical protein [Pseudomonas sp. PS01298]|uniref:hypothetical protein n=1 Tax=Pseudomonas sp. PS01298 TaxID=2991434 RepID=UPI00249A8C40|nr:hypothetical protein [Pseudomonas sp. PS01298]